MQAEIIEIEKRKVNRAKINVILRCKSKCSGLEETRHYIAYAKDISVSGVMLVLPEDIRVGDFVEMNFEIPEYFIAPLAYGEVAWIKNLQSTESKFPVVNEAGIKLLRINALDREKLELFIKSREARSKEERYSFLISK